MKKLLFIASLLALLAPVAHAGTITITVVTAAAPCNAGACTKTYTDTDANLGKIVTAYAPLCMAQNLVGTPPVATVCTPVQTLTWWANGIIAGTVANVTNFLKQQQAAAAPVIVPINPQ